MQTHRNGFTEAHVKPEQRLLLACARTDLSLDRKDLILTLAKQAIDWRNLLMLAQRHGVVPILYRSLAAVGRVPAPNEVLESLRMQYLTNAGKNLVFVRELFKILDLLNREGVRAVPIKGPVLAASSYGNVSLRQFCDLDILVHRDHIRRSKELLTTAGYVNNFGLTAAEEDALINYQKDFQFVAPGSGTIVELHWALEPGSRFRSFNDETVWKRLTTVTVEGRDVPALGPEDALLYLCLHGANHRWDRLCWICDTAETIARNPELDWEPLIEEARKLRCQRVLFLGLILATSLLDAPVPSAIALTAMSYPHVGELASLVNEQLFDPPSGVSDLRRSFSFHSMVRESLLDKAQLWGRRVLLPDALDFRASKFPPALFFLLPLFRPLRLLAKHVPPHLVPSRWKQ